MRRREDNAGSVMTVLLFSIVIVWVLLAGTLTRIALENRKAARARMAAQALQVAEGGIAKALWEHSHGRAGPSPEDVELDVGKAEVETRLEDGRLVVTSTGYVPDKRRSGVRESVRVEAKRDGKGVYRVSSWHRL